MRWTQYDLENHLGHGDSEVHGVRSPRRSPEGCEPHTIELTIQGEPVAQGRPRAAAWRNKAGKLTARVYSPPKSARWRARAAQEIRASYRGEPLAGPLEVEINCIFRCPIGDERKRDPQPRRWHAKKPDCDNLGKATLDAARGLLYADDAQVAVLTIRKQIAAQGEAPRVVVRVRRISEVAA